jgi:hypothetical protein
MYKKVMAAYEVGTTGAHGLRSSPIRGSLGVRLQNVRKRALVSFHRMCLRCCEIEVHRVAGY